MTHLEFLGVLSSWLRRPGLLAGLALWLGVWAGPGSVLAQGIGGGKSPSKAEVPAIFEDADLPLGRQLIVQHQCAACHVRRVGGDGSSIYRPAGRINSPGALRGMIEQCNLELNLTLFPDEVTAISAVLNSEHYRFKK